MISEESHISTLSIEKQDDEDIRCPNCYWYFSINTKPYILPCFHNLCDKCINNLIQEKNPKCPVCSKTFSHNGENPFQVNFGFLNLVTKILTNKIIFCKNCYKIYYWKDHCASCNQEDFIEADEIFNDIKKACDNGINIINLINDKDNNNNILNKYKNEIMVLLTKMINKIRKKNLNKIKKELENLFTQNGKEKFEFNFEDIKNNIVSFLLICINYPEYFDKNEIIKTIGPYIILMNNPNMNILAFKNNQFNKKSNILSNNTMFNQRKKIKNENNNSNQNTTYTTYKINKIIFAQTPTKEKIIFEKKKNKIINDKDKDKDLNICTNNNNNNVNQLYNDKCFSENKDNKIFDNKIKNKKEKESEDELIDNNDDDYFDNETQINERNKQTNSSKNKTTLNKKVNKEKNIINGNDMNLFQKKVINSSSKKIPVKDIFEKSIQDTKIQKKIIIGLNETKIISLQKMINNNKNKSNSQDVIMKNNKIQINKNQNKENINDKNYLKINEFTYRENNNNNETPLNNNINVAEEKNNKISLNKIEKKITQANPLTILLSPDLTKSYDYSSFKNIKNIKKYISPKMNINSTKNRYSINMNNLRIKKGKEKINLYLFNKNKKNTFLNISNSNDNFIKKKQFINFSNINNLTNTFFEGDNTRNSYGNILSTPNNANKTMNNILKNFNTTKDIISNINKFTGVTEYINSIINNDINNNISLLKENLSEDYNLLLNEVINNYFNVQRNYLFSFKNNTKSIVLFDIEYNNFIPLDLSDILTNFPNFNSSIQFEFIDNNDSYLLFITGGNERIIKGNNNYSSDSFLIINIKLNINIDSKNKIDYTKKYIIEYKDKMPLCKSHHSTIFYNNNLYIIGGYDNNKIVSKECFYFSYKNKSWHNMPNLNMPRANCSICLYNKSILYIFRGRNNEGGLNTIEYLDINNIENNNWNLINVLDYGFVWNNIYNSCVVPFEENRILIFGGEDENKIYKESFLFDINNNNVYRGLDLKIPAAFNGQGIYNNGKIYGFDFKNKNGDYEHKLHIFDIQNNYWSLISYEKMPI